MEEASAKSPQQQVQQSHDDKGPDEPDEGKSTRHIEMTTRMIEMQDEPTLCGHSGTQLYVA